MIISWLWSTVSSAWDWVLYADPSCVSVIMHKWSKTMSNYNTLDSVKRDREQKYKVGQKKWPNLSELCQIFTKFANFFHMDSQDNRIMWNTLIVHIT